MHSFITRRRKFFMSTIILHRSCYSNVTTSFPISWLREFVVVVVASFFLIYIRNCSIIKEANNTT